MSGPTDGGGVTPQSPDLNHHRVSLGLHVETEDTETD